MKKLSILFLFGLLLLASCNNQVEPGSVDTPASGDTPLSVSSVSLSEVKTKSTTAQTSGSIGVFRTTANSYTALNNVQYTYSSGWSTTSPIYLKSTAASVCAYSPYGAANITGSTDPTAVTLTSQKYDTAQDLCYSTLVSTPTSASPSVAFTMNHAYAKLYFNITRNATYPNACAITNISISNANNGIKTAGTLNMTTGAYGTGTAGTVSYDPGISSIASGGSATSQVLMVPVTTAMTGNVNINFTIDGTVYTASFSTLTTLAAGSNYKINITVQASSLSVTGVDVAAWTDYNATDIGYLPDVVPQPESNCYIVAPNATIYIPVSRASTGNSTFLTTDAFTTGLLWSDISATHVTATAEGRYIKIVATATEGNSVVYAMKGSTIVWSWHIWVTNYNPGLTANTGTNTTTYQSANGLLWMDRNLGATTVANGSNTLATCGGLMYQWGRKDPFPGSNGSTTGDAPTAVAKTIYGYTAPTTVGGGAVTAVPGDSYVKNLTIPFSSVTAANAFSYSVQYPLVYFVYWAGSTATAAADGTTAAGGMYSWNNSDNTKTIYDPCPVGWRVPAWIGGTTSPWAAWTTNGTFTTAVTAYSARSTFGNYPALGYRLYNNGALGYVGSSSGCWAGSVYGTYAYDWYFTSGNAYPSDTSQRGMGLSVRCVKN